MRIGSSSAHLITLVGFSLFLGCSSEISPGEPDQTATVPHSASEHEAAASDSDPAASDSLGAGERLTDENAAGRAAEPLAEDGAQAGGAAPVPANVAGEAPQGEEPAAGGDAPEAAENDDMTAGDQSDPAPELVPATAHPLYPALDLATLPLYGTASFTYQAPALPNVTRSVTVTTRAELERECALETGSVHIDVAADLVAEGQVHLQGSDCDIALLDGARIGSLYLAGTPQRVRVTGGQIGAVSNMGVDVSDIVFDGVAFNTGLLPAGSRPGMIFTLRNINRLAIINSIGRAAPTANAVNGGNVDGGGFFAQDVNNVLLANNNFACARTATANGWFARIETGSNWLVIDNMVRVYQHKMIRLSDFHNGAGPQFDYLVARGGTWMHATYETMYDQMSHGGQSDHVFIEGVTFYVDDATNHQVTFGAQLDNQLTRSWHGTDLHWYARSERTVGDAVLAQQEGRARPGEDLQYRLGSPTYTYQPEGVTFPAFRQIGSFADSDPENLPTL
jgi:hypothetical protein